MMIQQTGGYNRQVEQSDKRPEEKFDGVCQNIWCIYTANPWKKVFLGERLPFGKPVSASGSCSPELSWSCLPCKTSPTFVSRFHGVTSRYVVSGQDKNTGTIWIWHSKKELRLA
jgi:hypothetical protein